MAQTAPARATSEAEAALRARRQRVILARQSVNAFCELVFKDEKTGQLYNQAGHHREWQRLADQYRRLVLFSYPGAGKTQQLSVGRVLWLLGRNPSLRLAVISRTGELALKIVRVVGQYIEHSRVVHEVFPELLPDPHMPWTQHQLYVRRPDLSKDASLQSYGVGSQGLHGSRLDGFILDDVVNFENSRTKHNRDELHAWYEAVAASRLSDDGFVLAIGNAFHPDDLLHRFAGHPSFVARRFPVVDAAGNSSWPEKWSAARIAEKRRETSAVAFAQQYLCDARADESAMFKREWIDAARARGAEVRLDNEMDLTGPLAVAQATRIEAYLGSPLGYSVVHGVDLAISKKDGADLTAVFSLALYPDETRRLIGLRSGRWSFPETIDAIREVHGRLGGTFIVESNAYQAAVVQQLQRDTGIRVYGAVTSQEKHHPTLGIPALAVDFRNGKWVVPSAGEPHPEVEAWLSDLLYYDPASHTGDRLMACYLAERGISLGYVRAPKPVKEKTLTEQRMEADVARRRARMDPW